ncbi:MAG: hypothetical protein DWH82_06465 [Planctomycetota bacterium]|nr:MAG: hypothetical protein DWH82_06465 [Planctomycetota bacterium]
MARALKGPRLLPLVARVLRLQPLPQPRALKGPRLLPPVVRALRLPPLPRPRVLKGPRLLAARALRLLRLSDLRNPAWQGRRIAAREIAEAVFLALFIIGIIQQAVVFNRDAVAVSPNLPHLNRRGIE